MVDNHLGWITNYYVCTTLKWMPTIPNRSKMLSEFRALNLLHRQCRLMIQFYLPGGSNRRQQFDPIPLSMQGNCSPVSENRALNSITGLTCTFFEIMNPNDLLSGRVYTRGSIFCHHRTWLLKTFVQEDIVLVHNRSGMRVGRVDGLRFTVHMTYGVARTLSLFVCINSIWLTGAPVRWGTQCAAGVPITDTWYGAMLSMHCGELWKWWVRIINE